MRTIRATEAQELSWVQLNKRKRIYELRAGDEAIALLRWEKQHSQIATGEAAEGRWTFLRRGFLAQQVVVRQGESELEIARFQPNWRGGGTLECADGRCFGLRPTSFWNAEWAWTTPSNDIILRLKRSAHPAPVMGRIDLLPGASTYPELSLLILLAWYLVLLAVDDATVATLAATTAAVAAG